MVALILPEQKNMNKSQRKTIQELESNPLVKTARREFEELALYDWIVPPMKADDPSYKLYEAECYALFLSLSITHAVPHGPKPYIKDSSIKKDVAPKIKSFKPDSDTFEKLFKESALRLRGIEIRNGVSAMSSVVLFPHVTITCLALMTHLDAS
jgi:hypothetical protein